MPRDWTPVRAAYVEGVAVDQDGDPYQRTWPTLEELAHRFGCGLSNLKGRCAHERWTEQRERFRLDLDTERRRLVIEKRATRSATIDDHALANTEAAMALLGQRLGHLVERERHAVAQTPGDRLTPGSTVHPAELAALGLAAQRWARVAAIVQGRPDTASELDDAEQRERDQQIGESLLAASLAEHVARRSTDVDDQALDTP